MFVFPSDFTVESSLRLPIFIFHWTFISNNYSNICFVYQLDTMSVCFICDAKLYGERTQVCSNSPHSDIPYPQKIAELLGDEVVVIVTPADQMCEKCTSLLNYLDKSEIDGMHVKNAILSFLQKKYGILPPDQAVKDVDIVSGHLKEQEKQKSQVQTPLKLLTQQQQQQQQQNPTQVEQGQQNVPSGLTIGVSPAAAVVMPIQTPSELIKTQEQKTKQQQKQQQQQQPSTKVYKCSLCTFQSKVLDHVQSHMRSHVNKKEPEKPILNKATKSLTPVPQQKKQIFRCQVCSKSFSNRINCLYHIQEDHNQIIPSTSSAERGTEDFRPVTTKVMEPEPPMTQKNNQQAESPMYVNINQQDNNKGTVKTDMMWNDHVPAEEYADIEQEEETDNSQRDRPVKEGKLELKPESAQEKANEEEENIAVLGQEKTDQETSVSFKKEVDEDNENVRNKTGDLDITQY